MPTTPDTTTTAGVALADAPLSLAHLPVALFTVPMALIGLALVGRRAATATGLGAPLAEAVLLLGVVVLVAVVAAYLAKLVRHPEAVLADWRHAVRLCLFAALPMAFVLLAVGLLPGAPGLALAVWLLGTLAYLLLLVAVTNAWMQRAPIDLVMLNPTWFLPIAGPVLIAHAGPRLGFVELSWLIVGASVLSWIALQALLFYRLVFLPQLPPRLQPSLAIQIGPAPLIFIGLCELGPGIEPLGRVLYNSGLAIALMLAPRLIMQAMPFLSGAPFQMGWWAYSFPLSALGAATFLYAERTGSAAHVWIGLAIFLMAFAVTATLLLRTVRAAMHGALLRPEP